MSKPCDGFTTVFVMPQQIMAFVSVLFQAQNSGILLKHFLGRMMGCYALPAEEVHFWTWLLFAALA